MAISPFTGACSDETMLVDQAIGSAYKVVRHVSEHIEFIKHVSAHMAEIYLTSASMADIEVVVAKIADIELVNTNIADIAAVAAQINAISAIYLNLAEILEVQGNLTELLDIQANLNSFLAIIDTLGAIDGRVTVAENGLVALDLRVVGSETDILALGGNLGTVSDDLGLLSTRVGDNEIAIQGTVKSITAGENIVVDMTDPENPVISSAGGDQRFIRAHVVDTTGISPATGYVSGSTIDGVIVAAGELILRATISGDPEDGLYVVPAVGASSRVQAFEEFDDLPGTAIRIMLGTNNANTEWRVVSQPGGILGTTNIVVEEFIVDLIDGSVTMGKIANDIYSPVNYEVRLGGNLRPTALYNNDPTLTGFYNVLIGRDQFTSVNDRTTQTLGIGYDVGKDSVDVYGATLIGFRNGSKLVTSNYATGVGIDCFTYTVTVNASTAIGAHCATYKNQVDLSFIAGSFAAYNPGIVTNSVTIGYTAGGTDTANPTTIYSYDNCVVIGWQAGKFLSGDDNTLIGYNVVGGSPLTGAGNTYVGSGAGNSGGQTGSQNTGIGQNCGPNGAYSNSTSIGYDAHAGSSNHINLGNTSITSLRCQQTSITAISDQRDKIIEGDLPIGLAFIKAVRTVWFTWAMRGGSALDGTKEAGIIAQELDATAKEFGAEWMDLVCHLDEDRLQAAPHKLIFPLIKAVQELSAQVEELRSQIT